MNQIAREGRLSDRVFRVVSETIGKTVRAQLSDQVVKDVFVRQEADQDTDAKTLRIFIVLKTTAGLDIGKISGLTRHLRTALEGIEFGDTDPFPYVSYLSKADVPKILGREPSSSCGIVYHSCISNAARHLTA